MALRPYDGAKEPDTPDPCGVAHRAAPGPVLRHLQHLSAAQPREAYLPSIITLSILLGLAALGKMGRLSEHMAPYPAALSACLLELGSVLSSGHARSCML